MCDTLVIGGLGAPERLAILSVGWRRSSPVSTTTSMTSWPHPPSPSRLARSWRSLVFRRRRQNQCRVLVPWVCAWPRMQLGKFAGAVEKMWISRSLSWSRSVLCSAGVVGWRVISLSAVGSGPRAVSSSDSPARRKSGTSKCRSKSSSCVVKLKRSFLVMATPLTVFGTSIERWCCCVVWCLGSCTWCGAWSGWPYRWRSGVVETCGRQATHQYQWARCCHSRPVSSCAVGHTMTAVDDGLQDCCKLAARHPIQPESQDNWPA